MQPIQWEPSVKLSASEQVIVKWIRRAKLFIFLREHRHEVFDLAFQEELAKLYQDSPPLATAHSSSKYLFTLRHFCYTTRYR